MLIRAARSDAVTVSRALIECDDAWNAVAGAAWFPAAPLSASSPLLRGGVRAAGPSAGS
jgi:hypothetical protein